MAPAMKVEKIVSGGQTGADRAALDWAIKAAGLKDAPRALRQFIHDRRIRILNIAGPRASKELGVGAFVTEVLNKTWPAK